MKRFEDRERESELNTTNYYYDYYFGAIRSWIILNETSRCVIFNVRACCSLNCDTLTDTRKCI